MQRRQKAFWMERVKVSLADATMPAQVGFDRRVSRSSTVLTSTSRLRWLGHEWRIVTGTFDFAVPAVEHEGNVALFETRAELRAVAIAERMIQYAAESPSLSTKRSAS